MSYTDIGGFRAACATGTVKLSIALRIVRKDGTVFGFTRGFKDYDLPAITVGAITVPSTTYKASPNIILSNLVESSDLKANNLDLELTLGDDVTEADVRKGLFRNASWTLLFFMRDATTKQQLRQRGTIGDVSVAGQRATFKLRSLADKLQHQIIDLTSPLSRYKWGDAQMAFFNLTGLTADGYAAQLTGGISTVVDARREFTLSSSTSFPVDRFTEGVVEFLTGANAGLQIEVLKFTKSTGHFRLWHPMEYDMAPGDSVRITIKVPQTIAEWILLIGDAERFGGEDSIVTMETAANIADTLQSYTGHDESGLHGI